MATKTLNPLHFYLTGDAADHLADEFGDYLEHLTKQEKLAMINVLSGVLYQLQNNPSVEYSILDYASDLATIADELPTVGSWFTIAFKSTLDELDDCESSWIETLVMVLAIAVTEETSQYRQRQAVG